MEAPDKIYVSRPIYNQCGLVISEDKPMEYIRKDFLLEWAKAEIELSKRVECVSEKSYEEGRQQVAQNLIYKLNSL